jgi:hypothetical protein
VFNATLQVPIVPRAFAGGHKSIQDLCDIKKLTFQEEMTTRGLIIKTDASPVAAVLTVKRVITRIHSDIGLRPPKHQPL